MPPSAGACHTMDAAAKPDCGRAALRSSIMTAMGCRFATAGSTRRPVSGSGTVVGVGTGVGVGLADGDPDVSGLALDTSPRARLPPAATDGPGDVTRATGE